MKRLWNGATANLIPDDFARDEDAQHATRQSHNKYVLVRASDKSALAWYEARHGLEKMSEVFRRLGCPCYVACNNNGKYRFNKDGKRISMRKVKVGEAG